MTQWPPMGHLTLYKPLQKIVSRLNHAPCNDLKITCMCKRALNKTTQEYTDQDKETFLALAIHVAYFYKIIHCLPKPHAD